MRLTRHDYERGATWALDGWELPSGLDLSEWLSLPRNMFGGSGSGSTAARGRLLAPCDEGHEIWAAGVTYLRSREEREAESSAASVYAKVYDAERPELFFKSIGRRVVGHGQSIRIRRDSEWNVPEPELTLVINSFGEIVGYTAGNDVSSRSIEGENPLYLPQAKVYDGSCALGPTIELVDADRLSDLPIQMDIVRDGDLVFLGQTRTSAMRRTPQELVSYLFRETRFPNGVFLMTGTGIVPPPTFSLRYGDLVRITVGDLTLENPVENSAGPKF
jgi:2-dehydro-3-deoxy-D-arabinonate dehydratase